MFLWKSYIAVEVLFSFYNLGFIFVELAMLSTEISIKILLALLIPEIWEHNAKMSKRENKSGIWSLYRLLIPV